MKKLFVAISTQEGLKPTAPQVIKKLKVHADLHGLDVRWTPMDNYHVTLVFLGNTREDKIPDIKRLLDESAAHRAPFQLKITDIGAFPDEFKSRVLWFGVQNSKALRALQEDLSQKLLGNHESADVSAYSPHLTIARLRNPHKTKDMVSPFTRKKIGKVSVSEIVLYESVGSVPYPVYKALYKVPLTGSLVDGETTDSSSSEVD